MNRTRFAPDSCSAWFVARRFLDRRNSISRARWLVPMLGWVLAWHAAGSAETWAQTDSWPLTVAEQSDFRATSRSAEVLEFIDRLAEKCPHVRRIDFGKTVEGRPMAAAVVAQPPLPELLEPPADGRLRVLLLGNIHSGECDGKEALLMLLRELAQQPDHPWLKHLVLVCVPNYNADGNDRMRKDNRPGQIGPEEGMGERANAQDYDLNRDFVKIEAPETQCLIALVNRWDPHLFIDAHTTNGSQHRYPLTYDVPHNPASPAAVRQFLRQEMMPEVTRRLERQNITTYYYGNFNRDYTQWTTYGDEPRHSTEYLGLRGRLAILAESYAYIPYQERIVATREFVRACLDFTASRVDTIGPLLDEIRHRALTAGHAPEAPSPAEDTLPIQSAVTAVEEQVVIRGFKRDKNGDGRWITTKEPQDYRVDFETNFQPLLTVSRPYAYLLPASATVIAEKLRRHGIQVERLAEDVALEVEYYNLTAVQRAPRAYQGHLATRVDVERQTAHRPGHRGDHVIRCGQPLANLIVYLLEPQSADGLVAWNLFDPELVPASEYPIWRVPTPVALPLEQLTVPDAAGGRGNDE